MIHSATVPRRPASDDRRRCDRAGRPRRTPLSHASRTEQALALRLPSTYLALEHGLRTLSRLGATARNATDQDRTVHPAHRGLRRVRYPTLTGTSRARNSAREGCTAAQAVVWLSGNRCVETSKRLIEAPGSSIRASLARCHSSGEPPVTRRTRPAAGAGSARHLPQDLVQAFRWASSTSTTSLQICHAPRYRRSARRTPATLIEPIYDHPLSIEASLKGRGWPRHDPLRTVQWLLCVPRRRRARSDLDSGIERPRAPTESARSHLRIRRGLRKPRVWGGSLSVGLAGARTAARREARFVLRNLRCRQQLVPAASRAGCARRRQLLRISARPGQPAARQSRGERRPSAARVSALYANPNCSTILVSSRLEPSAKPLRSGDRGPTYQAVSGAPRSRNSAARPRRCSPAEKSLGMSSKRKCVPMFSATTPPSMRARAPTEKFR